MKQTVKRIVDFVMIVLLPILMAEVLIGQEIHEWLGTGMLALFIAHHILNFGWRKSFPKGKYTPSRAFYTTIILLLSLDMLALCVSGVMMSGFVFSFLNINGGMILARQFHLFASYWGFILMSAHLGLHIEQFFGLGRKLFHLSEKNAARTRVLRALAVLAAGVSGRALRLLLNSLRTPLWENRCQCIIRAGAGCRTTYLRGWKPIIYLPDDGGVEYENAKTAGFGSYRNRYGLYGIFPWLRHCAGRKL